MLKLGPQFDVPALYLDPGRFRTKLTDEAEVHWIETLKALVPDLIVLAGFMRVIKAPFLQAFPKIINLHPSLLPKYPGLHAIRRAWEDQESQTGCTVHWVNEGVDTGAIIDQTTVSLRPGEPLESLQARIHEAEHQLLPAVIKRLAREHYVGQMH
jgi:phosphoribosylglycinamide formyltransferase-1